jgi:hypothetical protein
MDKANIELTKQEAEIIAVYLPAIRLQNVTVANAPEAMKIHIQVQGIIEKLQKAFGPPAEPAAPPVPQTQPVINKPRRRR